MFQKLEDLRTGSLLLLTGLAGAGKSHLAAVARARGTIWILDTEGAAQNLLSKVDVHSDMQAVQTLSLKQLLAAMAEIRRIGQPGDTVILDSISKVLQAMRSHAAQRAGADSDKKTSLAYDEHASVNRNMQAIYTALTELKHAGFHVIIIGHLAKKYQSNGKALSDVGLRVLADENITYEADAILLVERTGQRRTVKPIIKPPRMRHLELDREYPAVLASLFPAQVELAETRSKFLAWFTAQGYGAPTWAAVRAYMGDETVEPSTVEGWRDLGRHIQAIAEHVGNRAAPGRSINAMRREKAA